MNEKGVDFFVNWNLSKKLQDSCEKYPNNLLKIPKFECLNAQSRIFPIFISITFFNQQKFNFFFNIDLWLMYKSRQTSKLKLSYNL